MTKQQWLDVAEVIDALRIVPRIIIAAFFVFMLWYVHAVTIWYFANPDAEWAGAAFAGGTVTALTGLFTKLCDWYFQSGRRWNGHQD